MCGIFGYAGATSPDPLLLSRVADLAGRRGPHGCGWTTYSAGAGLDSEHHTGPLSEQLNAIRTLRPTTVLGHARLATVGDWRRVDQLQPVIVDSYVLAHNGVIRNPGDLAAGHATDSIALAHAYAELRRDGVDPAAALDKLVAIAAQQAWAIVVLDQGQLYAHRRYHPLYRLRVGDGTYLSSQRPRPEAELLPEDEAVVV